MEFVRHINVRFLQCAKDMYKLLDLRSHRPIPVIRSEMRIIWTLNEKSITSGDGQIELQMLHKYLKEKGHEGGDDGENSADY